MLLDLALLNALTLWSLLVGRRLLAAVDSRPRPAIETAALSIPLGLGILALGTLALGEVGGLQRSSLVVFVGSLAILCLIAHPRWPVGLLWCRRPACNPRAGGTPAPQEEVERGWGFREGEAPAEPRGRRRLGRGSAGASPSRNLLSRGVVFDPRRREGAASTEESAPEGSPGDERRPLRPTATDAAFLAVLSLGVLGTLLSALAPVTDGDALCYHLQVPKVFLARGSVFFDPDLHETIYPLLTELLYADALAFRGPVACRLVQWLLGLVFALNVTVLARPSLGPRAWWAGTIALLVPAVSNGMGAPLNDVSLAAFGTAAIVAWSRFQDRPEGRTAVLAGILTGLALGVKYPALVLAGLLGATIAARAALGGPCGWRARVRTALGYLTLFTLAAVAAGGWWYLRAGIHTGNPVYPFFRAYFGGAGLDEVLDPRKKAMPVNVGNLLAALGLMTLQPQRFDSFSHQFGPLFLLFVPALLLEKPPRRVLGLVALGYAFLMLCLTQRQSTRFVLIAVGPLSVAAAWLAAAWAERRSWPGRLLVAAMLLCLAMEAGLAAARSRQGLSVVLGVETAEQYLARREPTYRVGRWVAEHLPEDARIVGQDHRGFYFPCGYTMELAHRRRTGLGRRDEPARAVVAALRARGFTHVLLCPPVPEDAVEFDPTLGRLLGPWLDGRTPLYARTIADGDGVARRFAIYALDEGRTAHGERRERR